MIEIKSGEGFTLANSGQTLIEHSKTAPFIVATEIKRVYKSDRGTFKIVDKVVKRTPLVGVEVLDSGENTAKIRFFADGISVLVQMVEEQKGRLRFDFTGDGDYTYKFRFKAFENEGMFGGGEQYRKLNLKGEIVRSFVSEHIKFSALVQKVLFGRLYREREHKDIGTYSPMSVYVSSERYALRFTVSKQGFADFTHKSFSEYTFSELPSKLTFFKADSFAELSKALNDDVKNREQLPDWAYDGMILGVQGGIDRAAEKAEAMQSAGARVNGVWCQDWSGQKITAVGKQVYWNWQVDEERYGDLKNRIAKLKEKGVHFLAYINPYLVKDSNLYNFCKDKNYLIKKSTGEIYHIKSTTFDAGMIDLTNPDATRFIKDVLIKQNMLDLGIDGYMADFGEYLPMDSVLFAGDAETLHNEWPTMWAKLNREAIEEAGKENEVFFFTRSGYNGCQSYTTMMWNGDQHVDFTKDYGLPCVMPATFSLGFSGVPLVHSDVGGFFSFMKLVRTDELFVRWSEMSAFSPLMRSHECIRPDQNVQYDGENVKPLVARLTRIHARLKPYLQHVASEARERGLPAMRPDFYDDNDFNLHFDDYSYHLGSEVFVCPIVERNAKKRRVHLPKGEWLQFFTDRKFSEGEYELETKLGTPLAFYKADGEYSELFTKISLEER